LFAITSVPLCEVGHFEAKCFFLKKGESMPVWPQGFNSVINVEPATCCGNPDDSQQRCMRALDDAGYTVIVKCQDIDDPSLTVKSVRT
jgi:hypothetical protein